MSTFSKALLALSSILLIALVVVSISFLRMSAANASDASYMAKQRGDLERLEADRDAWGNEREQLKDQLAALQHELTAQQAADNQAAADEATEVDPAHLFDELAATREQLASVKEQLAAAELLRDQAQHDTTMWRQQVERERRRAGTADVTQQDEDIAALSAELVEQAEANERLTATMAMALERMDTQNDQIAELVRYLSRLARRLGDTEADEGSTPEEHEQLEELHANIAQLHNNFARVAGENYDLSYQLENVTHERDALQRQLDQMLQLPGPNLDKSQAR